MKKIKSPILVLQGQCDYIPYSAAFEYVDFFPCSQYRFIEQAGHEIWWEQEDQFIDEIVSFLRSNA